MLCDGRITSGGGEQRPTYSRHDFSLVFWPAGILVALTTIPILLAARVMSNNDRRIRRGTSAGTMSSVESTSRESAP